MDKIDLDAVLAVDSCLSFSEAAVQTSFSQSAVSKHVAAVEEELGVKLFNRKTHSTISRTAYGEALLPELQACSDAFQRLYDHAAAIHQEEGNRLRVFCHAGIGALGEDEIITEFSSCYPEISIAQLVDKYGRLPGKACLDSVDLDFSLLSIDQLNALRKDGELEVIPLREHYPKILLAKKHPAAKGDEVDLSELRDEVFFFRQLPSGNEDNSDHRLLQLFTSACKSEGFTPDIRFVQLRSATVLNMVSAGLGVLPLMNMAGVLPENTVLLPTSKPYYSAVLTAYCYRSSPTPALRNFMRFLREHSTYSEQE